MNWSASQREDLPRMVAIGLCLTGVGLIGMTAGELPGLAAQLHAPRWLMGALGGGLLGSGLVGMRLMPGAPPAGRVARLSTLGAFAALGVLLAITGVFTGTLPHGTAAEGPEMIVNKFGRIAFGIGVGIVLGWAAYEGSRGKRRRP